MPGITYTRLDFTLSVRLAGENASLRLSWPGQEYRFTLATNELPGGPSDLGPAGLAQRLDLGTRLTDWRDWVRAEQSRLPPGQQTLPVLDFNSAPNALDNLDARLRSGLLPSLALDINDPGLAARPWEAVLWPSVQPYLINRLSPVRPSCLALPLVLPLRFVHVDPQGASIQQAVSQVLGHFGQMALSNIARVREVPLPGLAALRAAADWPTADVLHFDGFTPLPNWLLRVSVPEVVGTLGWFLRLAGAWQTRLIVLNCMTPIEADRAMPLAHAIVGRGGPAVLVTTASPMQFERFYDHLLHDVPVDANVLACLPPPPATRLFGGMGREEALRISLLWQQLLGLRTAIDDSLKANEAGQASELSDLLRRTTDLPAAAVRGTLTSMADLAETLNNTYRGVTFDHESNGLIPLQAIVAQLRGLAGVQGPLARPATTPPASRPTGPRFVNSSLWQSSPEGALSQLEQRTARLVTGETVQLAVQIGPQDTRVRAVGASALLEEQFKWTPLMTGVWVEVGVTGLDFEVLGSPVQSLWLPRDQTPSDTLFFAVVPRVTGAARLRFCLYYRNNVIQSFRLAAITTAPEQAELTAAKRRGALARALELPAKEVGDVSYLARLEYSLSSSMDDVPSQPRRVLSLVANHRDDIPVITLKTDEQFAVHSDKTLGDQVDKIRTLFSDNSVFLDEAGQRDYSVYGFGKPGASNRGTAAQLENILLQLAEAGWELYNAILSADDGQAVSAMLEQSERQVIHVAHILIDQVIPWAAVYDRFYDAGKQEEAGQPVAHAACLAALPDAEGNLPFTACGRDPACLLHPNQVQQRQQAGQPQLLPSTTACPLHLWGFKHIVEIPPQQVDQTGGEHKQVECILSARPARLAAGFNGSLGHAEEHWTELQKLQSLPAINAAWEPCRYKRDDVLKLLADKTLHLVYLYCHCRGGKADPSIKSPYLEFQDLPQPGGALAPVGTITAGQFHGIRWEDHPLVFLNGCGTAAYSPDAQSPFVKLLVRDNQAAGVIGTEVSVWEPLATEMAQRFLIRFLAGAGVGEALLLARRELLAQYNPLGLVYTLYAAAHLALDRDGDRLCT